MFMLNKLSDAIIFNSCVTLLNLLCRVTNISTNMNVIRVIVAMVYLNCVVKMIQKLSKNNFIYHAKLLFLLLLLIMLKV